MAERSHNHRRVTPRGLVWGLGSSVGLHALALLLGWRIPATPVAEPPAGEPIEVALLEPEQPAPPEPQAPPEPTEAPSRPSPVPAAPAPRARARTRGTEVAPQPRPTAPGETTASSPPAATEAPGDVEVPDPLRMRGGPSLQLDGATVERLTRDGVLAAPTAPEGEARPKRRILDGVAERQREMRARAYLEDGKVHPIYFDYARDAEKIFEPNTELAIELVRVHANKDTSVGRWVTRYLGGFFDAPGTPARQARPPEEAFNRAIAVAGVEHAVAVCVDTAAGPAPLVAVTRSSKIDRFDALAKETVTRAVARRPPELREQTGRACYRFSVRLTRIPPVPVLACALTLPPECVWPLKEIVTTHVVFEGFEPAAATGRDAGSTALPQLPL